MGAEAAAIGAAARPLGSEMSPASFRFRPAADRDIVQIAATISTGGLSVAYRFYASVYADVERLSAFPKLGPLRGFSNPAIADVRSLPVTDFRNYLILYRPLPEGGV